MDVTYTIYINMKSIVLKSTLTGWKLNSAEDIQLETHKIIQISFQFIMLGFASFLILHSFGSHDCPLAQAKQKESESCFRYF